MQFVLLVSSEHFSTLVTHKTVAVLDSVHVFDELQFSVEWLSAIEANRTRVLVHGLVMQVQRTFLNESFHTILALQHDRLQFGIVNGRHVRGQRLAAVARHIAYATNVAQMTINVQLVMTVVGKRPLAVIATVVFRHRRRTEETTQNHRP